MMQALSPPDRPRDHWPQQRRPHDLYASFSPRKAILGTGQYRQVPPAWREQQRRSVFGLPPQVPVDPRIKPSPAVNLPAMQGSQILVTNLPRDVDQRDIEELFGETIGKLHGVVLVHNKAGEFLGIAMVAFVQKDAALKAHQVYNGRIVDGRAPIRIDLVTDVVPPPLVRPRTLADRLGPPVAGEVRQSAPAPTGPKPKTHTVSSQKALPSLMERVSRPLPNQPNQPNQPRARTKMRKGPKRLQKKTAAQLDMEMEDWLASAPPKGD